MDRVSKVRTAHEKAMDERAVEKKKVQEALEAVEDKKAQFFKDLMKSTDLNDNL